MNDKVDALTVDKLFEILDKLKNNGYGDMQIKCGDVLLHDDEVGIRYYPEGKPGEVLFRGYLFHQPISEKVATLKEDIENAINKFYGFPYQTDEI